MHVYIWQWVYMCIIYVYVRVWPKALTRQGHEHEGVLVHTVKLIPRTRTLLRYQRILCIIHKQLQYRVVNRNTLSCKSHTSSLKLIEFVNFRLTVHFYNYIFYVTCGKASSHKINWSINGIIMIIIRNKNIARQSNKYSWFTCYRWGRLRIYGEFMESWWVKYLSALDLSEPCEIHVRGLRF